MNLKFSHKILLAASGVVVLAFALFTLYNDYLQRNTIGQNLQSSVQQAGALTVVDSEEGLGDALDTLLGDPALRAQMGAAGRALAESGRGALARTLTAVRL